jgi:hypothetical protein
MYVEGSVGGGGGRWPERRGTRLAPELDRKLAGDEPLNEVIHWWDEEWRAAVRLRRVLPHGDENVQPRNFSDNELAAFVIAITSGCGSGPDGKNTIKQLAELQWLWTKLGFEVVRMSDATYAEAVRDKYWTQLETARAELQQQRRQSLN